MAKRFFSIILVTLMALTVVPAFASVQSTLTDGFESIDAAVIDTDLISADAENFGGYTSDVWKMDEDESCATAWTGSFFFDGIQTLSLTPVKDGANTVMKVTKSADTTGYNGVGTVKYDFTDAQADDVVYVSFKVKVVKGGGYMGASEGGAGFSGQLIAFDSECFRTVGGDWESAGGGDRHNNEWCTVLIMFDKDGATNCIYDGNGNLISSGSRAFSATQEFSNARIMIEPGEAELYLDDAKIVVVNSDDTVALTADTIADKSNVNPSLKSVDLTFDQPVAVPADGTVTLTPAGGEAISCAAASINAGEGLRVSWTANLTPSTQYTLSYAGVTGMAGNVMGGTNALLFTTTDVASPATKYTDGFESETLAIGTDLISAGAANYGGYTSDVWRMDEEESCAVAWTGSFFYDGIQTLSLTPVKDGANTVMKVTKSANTTGYNGIGTIKYDFTGTQVNDVVCASFKLKVVKGGGYIGASESGAGFSGQLVAFDSERVCTVTGDWQSAGSGERHNSEWCTVMIVYDKNGATNYIYDSNGNLISSGSRAFSATQAFSNARIMLEPGEAELYLDDSSLTIIKSADTISYAGESVLSTDAWAPVIDLEFDAPIADLTENAVTCSFGGESVACTAEKLTPYTIRVTAKALAKGTYTIDFSGVKGIVNNRLFGASSVTFTAEADEVVLAKNKTIDIVVNDWTVSGDLTITVGNYKAAMNPVFYVALYSGERLVGAEKFTDKSLPLGVTDVTMTLSQLYEWVTDIKVIAVNSEEDFKPIMDSVDVSQFDELS